MDDLIRCFRKYPYFTTGLCVTLIIMMVYATKYSQLNDTMFYSMFFATLIPTVIGAIVQVKIGGGFKK